MKQNFKRKITIILFVISLFAISCLLIKTVDFLELLPESLLESLSDQGWSDADRALNNIQSHKSLPDRIVFYTKMADKKKPYAACIAASYLKDLGRLNERRDFLEKYAIAGDGCAAIERFYIEDIQKNVVWLKWVFKNDPRECRNLIDEKYFGVSVPKDIAVLCSKPQLPQND